MARGAVGVVFEHDAALVNTRAALVTTARRVFEHGPKSVPQERGRTALVARASPLARVRLRREPCVHEWGSCTPETVRAVKELGLLVCYRPLALLRAQSRCGADRDWWGVLYPVPLAILAFFFADLHSVRALAITAFAEAAVWSTCSAAPMSSLPKCS